MRLFYKILLVALGAAVAVLAYDLYQKDVHPGDRAVRIRYDARTGRFTLRAPAIRVRVVYASFMGPGEPVMRVRDKWINIFEEDYSDRLIAESQVPAPSIDEDTVIEGTLRRVAAYLPEAHRRLEQIDAADSEAERSRLADELADWLGERHIFLTPPAAPAATSARADALGKLVAGLAELVADPRARSNLQVLPRVVSVQRRWQGRWVLSANRPRFLTGRDVPDVISSDKMELVALVQDGYAVPMNQPLAGQDRSPLDGPDTWGDPGRSWREAFIPSLLAEGKYASLAGAPGRRAYLTPLTCSAFCIFYNKVLFRKVGIERPPRTWPEFLAACRKLSAADIYPLTADRAIYANYWLRWLIFRALGPEAWEGTVLGVPSTEPRQRRKSDPPWTDERYRQAFGQVRLLHERGYFDPDFRGSTFPAAQRGFASGGAAMMISGTWLAQELSGYKDIRSGERFELGCFSFPQWPGGRPRDQEAAHAQVVGMMVCRGGGATRHAVELVKFLSATDYGDMVHKNDQISCMADAPFPPALKGIEEDFRNAPVIYSRMPEIYARRFNAGNFRPRYDEFFLTPGDAGGEEIVEKLLQSLVRQTAEYLEQGGEEGYE